jgi:hypothetical protein
MNGRKQAITLIGEERCIQGTWDENEMSEAIIASVNESFSLYKDLGVRVALSSPEFEFSINKNETNTQIHKSVTEVDYEQANFDEFEFMKPAPQSPVYVEGGSIQVSSKQLEIGRQYPIWFNDKKYVVIMPKEGEIDLYEFS